MFSKNKNTTNEQTNTAYSIIDMLINTNPTETLTISNTHHTITIHTNGTWIQTNH